MKTWLGQFISCSLIVTGLTVSACALIIGDKNEIQLDRRIELDTAWVRNDGTLQRGDGPDRCLGEGRTGPIGSECEEVRSTDRERKGRK